MGTERDLDFDDEDIEDELEGEGEDVAHVLCPYCGESVEIALDPGGGPDQQYVEDCQVCCRPWHVHVVFGRHGAARVTVTAEDEADSGEDLMDAE